MSTRSESAITDLYPSVLGSSGFRETELTCPNCGHVMLMTEKRAGDTELAFGGTYLSLCKCGEHAWRFPVDPFIRTLVTDAPVNL